MSSLRRSAHAVRGCLFGACLCANTGAEGRRIGAGSASRAMKRPAPPVCVRSAVSASAYRLRPKETKRSRRDQGTAQVAPSGSADKRFLSSSPVSHAACNLLRRQFAPPSRFPAYAKHKRFLCYPAPSMFKCGEIYSLRKSEQNSLRSTIAVACRGLEGRPSYPLPTPATRFYPPCSHLLWRFPETALIASELSFVEILALFAAPS